MKRIILIVILLFSFITVNAEDYYHKGDTYYYENQYEIVSGIINENDISFKFNTTRDDKVKCNISVKIMEDDEQISELYHSYTFNTEGSYQFDLENFIDEDTNYNIDTDCYIIEDYISEPVDDSTYTNPRNITLTGEKKEKFYEKYTLGYIMYHCFFIFVLVIPILHFLYLCLARPKSIGQVIAAATKSGYTVNEVKDDINNPYINVIRVIDIIINKEKAKFYLFGTKEDAVHFFHYKTKGEKNMEREIKRDNRKNRIYPTKYICLNSDSERLVFISNTAFYYSGSAKNAEEVKKFAKKIGY